MLKDGDVEEEWLELGCFIWLGFAICYHYPCTGLHVGFWVILEVKCQITTKKQVSRSVITKGSHTTERNSQPTANVPCSPWICTGCSDEDTHQLYSWVPRHHMYVCVYVYIYIYINKCMYIYIHIYIYIFICIYIYIILCYVFFYHIILNYIIWNDITLYYIILYYIKLY